MIRYVQGWSNLIKPRGLYWENFHQFFQYICLITMYWFLFTLLAFHIIKQTPDCATRCVTDGKNNIFPALFNQSNIFCHYLIKLFKMYTLVSKRNFIKVNDWFNFKFIYYVFVCWETCGNTSQIPKLYY